MPANRDAGGIRRISSRNGTTVLGLASDISERDEALLRRRYNEGPSDGRAAAWLNTVGCHRFGVTTYASNRSLPQASYAVPPAIYAVPTYKAGGAAQTPCWRWPRTCVSVCVALGVQPSCALAPRSRPLRLVTLATLTLSAPGRVVGAAYMTGGDGAEKVLKETEEVAGAWRRRKEAEEVEESERSREEVVEVTEVDSRRFAAKASGTNRGGVSSREELATRNLVQAKPVGLP